jgi:predicted Zn-dependent peptidase
MSDNTPAAPTLFHGNTYLHLESSDANEIVAIVFAWPVHDQILNADEEGLAEFTHRMLRRGTRHRGSQELADTIDSLGISISTTTDNNYSRATLVATTDTWREALSVLREMLLEPAFEPEELEKERVQTLAAIRRADDDLMDLTDRAWHSIAFPSHPLGRSRLGTPATVSAFTRSQVVAMHEALLSAPISMISVAGNVTRREIESALSELNWATESTTEFPMIEPTLPGPVQTTLTRESNQAYLFLGVRICPYGHPDWVPMRVMNTILGEGMSSRLFLTLRDKQGLAYATGSIMSGTVTTGTLRGYIGTKPDSLDLARQGMEEEFQRIQQDLVPEDELDRARKYLAGRFLIDHQTNARRAFYPLHFHMMGLGWDYGTRYTQLIESVTAEDVRRVAQKWLSGDRIIATLRPA